MVKRQRLFCAHCYSTKGLAEQAATRQQPNYPAIKLTAEKCKKCEGWAVVVDNREAR